RVSPTASASLPPSRTPLPTNTPVVTTVAEACEAIVTQVVGGLFAACNRTEAGEACNASFDVEVEPQFIYDGGALLRSQGRTSSLDDIFSMATSPITPAQGLWGMATMRLDGDINGQFEFLAVDWIDVIVFGDVFVENRVPPLSVQEDERSAIPAASRPPILPPMTQMAIETGDDDSECDGVPDGVLLQAPTNLEEPVTLVINAASVSFDGTIYVTATGGGLMAIDVLEGDADVTSGRLTKNVPPGSRVTFNLTEDLIVTGIPGELEPYNAVATDGLFTRAAGVSAVLHRDLVRPDVALRSELALIDNLNGVWTVTVRVTQLNGLLNAGDTVDAITIEDARQECAWSAGQFIGTTPRIEFAVSFDEIEEFLELRANFPGVPFPDQMLPVPGVEDIYLGTVTIGESSYEHTITFTSPTDFSWRVQAFNVPAPTTTCTGGIIEGEGFREPDRSLDTFEERLLETWQVNIFTEQDIYVPASLILEDCLAEPIAVNLPDVTLFTLSRTEDTIEIQAELEDVIFPSRLAATTPGGTVFTGDITEGDLQYFHELEFTSEALFTWRVMARSVADNCRRGTVEGRGGRF
ncbi:MAG: hypothetical protein AAFR56_07645, partial [Chloroflexota bacterium]